MSSARDLLLAKCIDYVFENGLADLSLRPLAKVCGTSARMLVYHFGSKEQLLVDVISGCERRWMDSLAQIQVRFPDPLQAMDAVWQELTQERWRRYLSTAFEAWGLSLSHPHQYRSLLHTMNRQWSDFLEDRLVEGGLSPQQAPVLACCFMATWNGLLLAVLGGAAAEITQSAYGELRAWMQQKLGL